MNHIAIMQSSLLGHPRPPIDKISIMGYTGSMGTVRPERVDNLYSAAFVTAAQINQSMRDHSDSKLYCAVRDNRFKPIQELLME